jgi:hypothetical protein
LIGAPIDRLRADRGGATVVCCAPPKHAQMAVKKEWQPQSP